VQHFIVGFNGATTEPSEDIKKLLRKPYYVGAVILMKRNVDGKRYSVCRVVTNYYVILIDAKQIRGLVDNLQKVAKEAGHDTPLMIGTDQEGGLVAAMTKGSKGCTQLYAVTFGIPP
jgi:beta-N-acetylhexosaminidase